MLKLRTKVNPNCPPYCLRSHLVSSGNQNKRGAIFN